MPKEFRNYPNCHSGSRLDEFAIRLLDFKKEGTYVDLGSAHSMFHNNSHFMDIHLDWRGVCVEMDPKWNDTYSDRKHCMYINQDATTVDYRQVFIDQKFPQSIDYLSIDVDILDLVVAKMLPHDVYRFKVIGIEHDHYQHGDKFRLPQREFLEGLGYARVCSDVYVRNDSFVNCSYEDWYLDPTYFSADIINKYTSNSCYPEDIIEKFL